MSALKRRRSKYHQVEATTARSPESERSHRLHRLGAPKVACLVRAARCARTQDQCRAPWWWSLRDRRRIGEAHFSAEKRYVERLSGRSLTDPASIRRTTSTHSQIATVAPLAWFDGWVPRFPL